MLGKVQKEQIITNQHIICIHSHFLHQKNGSSSQKIS